jgi:hypothetical protein
VMMCSKVCYLKVILPFFFYNIFSRMNSDSEIGGC